MATFVLVPGAMHGSWCWDRVVPLLEGEGHRAVAVDLPGMGLGGAAADDGVTLADWGDHVADVVRAQPGPVVLVGHSRGGLVIGEAAERVPALLAGLIYVAALLVPPGESVAGLRGVDPGAGPHAVPGFATLTAMFYQKCSPEDAAWAVARLEAEPLQMLTSAATITPERWGRVPRGYVECRDDATIALVEQRRMQAALPCDPVVTLDSDHSPWLSAPAALAGAMAAMARGFGG
ncbi:MAG: alpha/beta fold hydrolase [Sphingomonadales bacterium]|nr:alpha/beta fold hydrolase [Sphingomonadales bacterium]